MAKEDDKYIDRFTAAVKDHYAKEVAKELEAARAAAGVDVVDARVQSVYDALDAVGEFVKANTDNIQVGAISVALEMYGRILFQSVYAQSLGLMDEAVSLDDSLEVIDQGAANATFR